MGPSIQLMLNGQPADAGLLAALSTFEVEENVDMPSAIELRIPLNRTAEGDLSSINLESLQPYSNIAVVATAENESPQCIFDGFLLSHKLHLERGITSSSVSVWGQDASWLMNLEEKSREWADMSDATAANQIFSEYDITPAPENTDNDSPVHATTARTLMQNATDIQFLRMLGRRTGKLVRVICNGEPGSRIGHFARPKLDGDPVATLVLNDLEKWNVNMLDIEWDVTRPSEVLAGQTLFSEATEDGATADTQGPVLSLLDERDLAAFATKAVKTRLRTVVSDAEDLKLRAEAVLIDAGWFVKCNGSTEVSRLKKVLRAGTIVEVKGIGSQHSGKYFVWSVRHSITVDAHRMSFQLVRNAMGPLAAAPSFGGGLF